MTEEKKVAYAVPTEDDSQNSEEKNDISPREVDRQQTDNLNNSEIGSVIVQAEENYDNSLR